MMNRWILSGLLMTLWMASTSWAGGSCFNDSDCNDHNPCTQDVCLVVFPPFGSCIHTALSGICPDDGNLCTSDVCSSGACTHPALANGTACGSAASNPCDNPDSCLSGVCVPNHLPNGTPCADDGNSCTSDVCSSGACTHPTRPNGTSCNSDSNACTVQDHCSNGLCIAGTPVNCNDGNVCSADSCNPFTGSCDRFPLDGFACTDDGNECTNDVCNNNFLCTHPAKPAGTVCDDGNSCTNADKCNANGQCVGGPPPVCDDANVCTTDTCNPATGCVFTNNGEPCDDGNACTTNDTCSGGSCLGGSALNCDDDNACTDDFCDPLVGCVHADNSELCDDGDECTSNDQCAAGQCQGEQLFGIDEWRQFTECYDGVGVLVEVGCECSDLDNDGDVDLLDVAEFMRWFYRD